MDNKINVYTCREIYADAAGGEIVIKTSPGVHRTITIDRDEGTTPMIISCPICGEPAVSSMYQVDQTLDPTHEWYKPTPRYIRKLKRGGSPLAEHCELGGLLFREIG